MAKKGRDLFEILGARTSGGRPSRKSGKAAARGRAATGSGSWFDVVRALVRGPDAVAAKREAERAGPPLGATVAVVLAVGLLVGFGVGRWTAPTAGGAGGALRAAGEDPDRNGPAGTPPVWIQGTGGARGAEGGHDPLVHLTTENEEKKLSTWAYRLLPYPAPERDRAAQLATWLRERGVLSARLRAAVDRASSSKWWIVVAYTNASDDRSVVDELRRLAASETPEFEPRFGDRVLKLDDAPYEYADS